MKKTVIIILIAILLIAAAPRQVPEQPVKLIFIHHSTGENWLTDGYGNLGSTLGENNYFVSDTNYGWGPDGIGDATDIPNWVEWFASDETPTYMNALFNENAQNSSYTRNLPDPGGENEIIMFKSCFPNSDLYGNPNDPPGDYEDMTVAGAKYVYNTILDYFATRPDKLFIAITAPPLSDGTNAANARAFNNWLANDWLADYEGGNVAVFDFYDVLTGPNGGDTLYYPSDDDHPSKEGSRLATEAFVPQLNDAYQRWQAGDTSAPSVSELDPAAEAPPVPELYSAPPLSASSIIDDFESNPPAESFGWEAYSDEQEPNSTLSCVPSNEMAHEGERALKIEYDIILYSWGTCELAYENAQNWGDSEGISFYVYTEQAGTLFNVDIFIENDIGRENYFTQIQANNNGWEKITLRWDKFHRVDWEEDGGSVFAKPDQIQSIAFGFNTPDGTEDAPSGTIYIDDLTLGQASAEVATPELISELEEDAPAEEKPSGSPIPCVGGLVLPAGIAGLAFGKRKKK